MVTASLPSFRQLMLALVVGAMAAGTVVACASPQTTDGDVDAPADGTEEPADGEHHDEHHGEHHDEHHGEHHDEHHGDDADHHDHRFEDPEDYAEHWNDPERDEWQQPEAIIDAMDIEEGMTVADIGAGTGYFIPFLSDAVGDEGTVLAVDIEQSMLDYIEELADEQGLDNVETVLAEGAESGLDEASVDRILTVNTWHHIPERQEYSAHLLERLTDSGQVWVVDFHEDSPMGPPEDHRLTPQTIIDELEAGDLDAELHELELERQFVVVGSGQ